MGSMFDVMKRVRAEGPAPEAEAEFGATAAADADGAEASATGFMPTDAPAQPGEAVDEQTVEWDARRINPAVVAFHDRYSSVCEQFRAIRARLLSMNSARPSPAAFRARARACPQSTWGW